MLRKQIPFYSQLCILISKLKKTLSTAKKIASPQRITSPKLLTQFSSVGRVIRRNVYVESLLAGNDSSHKTIEKPEASLDTKAKKYLTFTECSLFQAAHLPLPEDPKAAPPVQTTTDKGTAPVSPGIEEEARNLQGVVVYCSCGRICKAGVGLCEECHLAERPLGAAGYLYVEKDEKNVDRYWFELINTDLYCKHIIH